MTNSIKKEHGSVNVTIVNNTIKQEKFSTCLQKYTQIRLQYIKPKFTIRFTKLHSLHKPKCHPVICSI